MREIIFRGKTLGGKWVEGSLIISYTSDSHATCNCFIYPFNYPHGEFQVIKETIGEYTGLKDINGVKIFEGDIVKTHDQNNTIEFIEGAFIVKGLHKDKYEATYSSIRTYLIDATLPNRAGIKTNLVIIGNKFENPELLEN